MARHYAFRRIVCSAAMTSRTERIVRVGSQAAYVVAGAGALALVFIGLFFAVGQPWGSVNDLALLVMTAALAPLMLYFYELGGRTPLRLAQAAQTLGWLAVLTWCATQVLMVIGVVAFDYYRAAAGAFAVQSLATVYIGLWIAGANLLAGPWLAWERWLGVLVGVGAVIFSLGLLQGGIETPMTYVGGLAYQVLLPIWALLMARRLTEVLHEAGR
jgi:hypothetical protein